MPWVKVDDSLAFHPKVLAAGNAAMGLWVRAASWSAANLTDGLIPADMIAALGGTRPVANRLVKAGLWCSEPGGFRFHDWLDYQPSAAQVAEVRELRRDAGRTGGARGMHQRWHVNRGITNPDCPWCRGDDEHGTG